MIRRDDTVRQMVGIWVSMLFLALLAFSGYRLIEHANPVGALIDLVFPSSGVTSQKT